MNSRFSFTKTLHEHPAYTVFTLTYTPASPTQKSLSVQIAPELGSNMFSFTYGDHAIIVHDKAILEACGFTGNFVLFPTPNRVTNYTYAWGDKQIKLTKRGKTVEIHGLVFDEVWNWAAPVVTEDNARLQTYIDIDAASPLFEAFPFPCRLMLTYTLTSTGVRIEYEVHNTGTEDLPFGFGLHPYFARLSGSEETKIRVPARFWMEAPDTLLPTGKLIPTDGKTFDLQKPVALSALNLDHVYTGRIAGEYATIEYPDQKLKVTLKTSDDFTHFVVYTGDPNAVCLENQTCSTDAQNLWAKGLKEESHLLTVLPGQTKVGYVMYEVSPT